MSSNLYHENYIVACCNLYGMIHKKRILFLYHEHHPNQTIDFDQLDLDYMQSKYVYYDKDFFISEAIFIHHEMSEHLNETNGKPFYKPSLEELVAYKDEFMIQESTEQKLLFDYVKNYENEVAAFIMIDDVTGLARIGASIQTVFEHTLSEAYTQEIIDDITPLIGNLYNHTRSWLNNGYTADELMQLQLDRKNLNKYEPCPCGSGLKYKFCCMNKAFIGEGNPDLYYEDVFKITERDKEDLRLKLNREYDRVLIHVISLKNPSMTDLMNDLMSKDLKDIIRYEPKIIMGALVKMLFDIHDMPLSMETEEKIFKILRIWTKRYWVEEVFDEIMYLLDSIDKSTDDEVMKNLLALYSKYNYKPKMMPKNKAYDFLLPLQKKTSNDKALNDTFEILSLDVYRSGLTNIPTHLYNMLHLYPLSVSTIYFLLEMCDPNDEETLLEAVIYAYEKTKADDLSHADVDFYVTDDHRIYIISLDRLAFIYKHKNKYKKAYPLYEKIIKYDKTDRLGAKESVLICYLYLNMMDKFSAILSQLDDSSVYSNILGLYILIEADQPFIHMYLDVKNRYKGTLDALCGIAIDDDQLSEPEHLFLLDFYHVLMENHLFIDKLKQVHIENIVR